MTTITESMSQLKGSGSSIFRDAMQRDDFHVVYLFALSCCNILSQKMCTLYETARADHVLASVH